MNLCHDSIGDCVYYNVNYPFLEQRKRRMMTGSWSFVYNAYYVPNSPESLLNHYKVVQLLTFWIKFVYYTVNCPLGAFTIYVDQFSEFFDPSLPISRLLIYWGLFSKVDIWLTPPSLSLVYVECKRPLFRKKGEQNDAQILLLCLQ